MFARCKNDHRAKTTYIIVLLILLNGCAAYYPQTVDIPLIAEKGDLRVDAGVSYTPSVHGTISYGLTNIVAIQAYGNIDVESRYHIQGAAGLFKGFENKTVTELYGGYGYGNSIMGHLFNPNIDYHLFFTQFNIGKTNQGAAHIDYGLGMKVGYLNANLLDNADLKTIHESKGLIMEPCIFFRLGGEKIRFNIKVNYLWTRNNIVDEYSTLYPVNVSTGVNFNF